MTTSGRAGVRLLIGAVVLAMVAAACTSTSDDGDAASSDGSTTTAAVSTTGSGDTAPATSEALSETDPATTEPGELTDSFRGVTAEAIKIGVGLVDGSEFGFDPGDIEAKWQSAAAAYNDEGGVLGRQLEVVVETYSPVGSTDAEAACVIHTEDEEVFAFVGSMREDNILCYTEVHDTVAINNLAVTDAQIERSNVLLLSASAPENALILDGLRQLGDEGYWEGRDVAITYSATSEPNLEDTAALLSELGATVVSETLSTAPPGDEPATRGEYDVFHERWEADGATAVVAMGIGESLGAAGAAGRAGSDLDVHTLVNDVASYERLGHVPGDVGGTIYAYVTQELADMYEAGENGVRECVDRFEAASGETVVVDAGPDDLANFAPTVAACRGIDMFVAIATAAGVDLTEESFTEAASSLGEFTMTGASAASLGPDKVSADDTPTVINVYDAAAADFVVR